MTATLVDIAALDREACEFLGTPTIGRSAFKNRLSAPLLSFAFSCLAGLEALLQWQIRLSTIAQPDLT